MVDVLLRIEDSLKGLSTQVETNKEDIKNLDDNKVGYGLHTCTIAGTVDIDGVPSVMGGELLITI